MSDIGRLQSTSSSHSGPSTSSGPHAGPSTSSGFHSGPSTSYDSGQGFSQSPSDPATSDPAICKKCYKLHIEVSREEVARYGINAVPAACSCNAEEDSTRSANSDDSFEMPQPRYSNRLEDKSVPSLLALAFVVGLLNVYLFTFLWHYFNPTIEIHYSKHTDGNPFLPN